MDNCTEETNTQKNKARGKDVEAELKTTSKAVLRLYNQLGSGLAGDVSSYQKPSHLTLLSYSL